MLLTIIIIVAVVAVLFLFAKKASNNLPVPPQESQGVAKHVLDETTVQSESSDTEYEARSSEDKYRQMRDLFNLANKGANGAALSRAYSKMMEFFTIKANGECVGAGFSGILYADERAKKIANIDDSVVRPALGQNRKMYEAWWMTFYQDAQQAMFQSASSAVRANLNSVFEDVAVGDEILERAGVFDAIFNPEQYEGYEEKSTYYENVVLPSPNGGQYQSYMDVKILNEGKKIKIRTTKHRINVTMKSKHDRIRYEITGAYRYFPEGLSPDPMIKYGEILMGAATLHHLSYKKEIDSSSLEKYDLPSLSKLD